MNIDQEKMIVEDLPSLYPLKDYERESFMKMFEDEDRSPYGSHFIHPDEVSSTIIDKYVKYLIDKD